MRYFFIMLLTVLSAVSGLFATITQSTSSGKWSAPSRWSTGVVPGESDTVVIASGHSVTVDGEYIIAKLTVQANAVMQFDSVSRFINTIGDVTVDAFGSIIPSASFAAGAAYHGIGVGGNLTVNGTIKDTVKGSESGTRALQNIKLTYFSKASSKTAIQGSGTISAVYLFLQKSAGTDTVFLKPGVKLSFSYLYLEGGTLENSKNNPTVFVVSRSVESSVLTSAPQYSAVGAGVSYLGPTNITAGIELPDTVKSFYVNLNKTVTVNKNIVVSGPLEYNNSRINMGNNTLRAYGTAENYGQKGYVIGTLERPISVNKYDSVKVFHVGTANGYAEVTVRLDTVKTAGTLAVRSYESMHSQMKDTTLALRRYWALTAKNGFTFGKGDVTLRYDAKDFKNNVSETADEKSLLIGKYDIVNFIGFWSYPSIGTRDTSGAGGTIQARGLTDLTATLVIVKNAKALSVPSSPAVPLTTELQQNYPNPFNPSTMIGYQLSAGGHTTLRVFDVLGKAVMTLVDEQQNAGTYTVRLNGSHLSSGCYFYTLTSGGRTMTKKLLLMK